MKKNDGVSFFQAYPNEAVLVLYIKMLDYKDFDTWLHVAKVNQFYLVVVLLTLLNSWCELWLFIDFIIEFHQCHSFSVF